MSFKTREIRRTDLEPKVGILGCLKLDQCENPYSVFRIHDTRAIVCFQADELDYFESNLTGLDKLNISEEFLAKRSLGNSFKEVCSYNLVVITSDGKYFLADLQPDECIKTMEVNLHLVSGRS